MALKKLTRIYFPFTLLLALITGCSNATPEPTLIPTPTDVPAIEKEVEESSWELVWQDEFDGETLNADNWVPESGAGGWGNSELQFYTDRSENLRVENGILVIEALAEDYHGSDYTSARIKSQYLQTWTYGRIEARMKIPTGQGVWSAFWMLGEDISSAGWPNSGEIDIMENIGEARTVYGTLHGPGYSGGSGVGRPFTVSGDPLHEDFHTYAIEWEPTEIRWYVDDAMFNKTTYEQVPGPWVYDHPFFILFNLAIGGVWPGYPDTTTEFPQQLLVDHVRVYRDPALDLEALKGGVLHVEDITMDLAEVDETWVGTAYVTITDQAGNPVEGVTVNAGWLGVVTGATTTEKTNTDGMAGPFIATKTSRSKEISFCISDVSMALFDYDKPANTMTCLFVEP